MRYLVAAFIASLAFAACTESAQHALGPVGDPSRRDPALFAAETVIDYGARPGVVPHMISQGTFHPANGLRAGSYRIVMSFVIDSAGAVIRNSVRFENDMPSELADACRDWLREAHFEPVHRGGRPIRAALRNVMATYSAR